MLVTFKLHQNMEQESILQAVYRFDLYMSMTFDYKVIGQGRVAQLVTCLATDVCLTADPRVAS